jgi:lysophospholipase L1-like esterase
LLIIEAGLQVGFRIKTDQWFFRQKERHADLFQFHPYLVGCGRPFAKASIPEKNLMFSHNSLGYRGDEVSIPKRRGVKRIVAFGGSATYCTGISDEETWPRQLEHLLGEPFEVVNAGVPGYSSVEHIIQTSLLMSDVSPDIGIYYIGWNDMRNTHIKGLKSDYSDFHAFYQFDNLGLSTPRRAAGSLALYYFVKGVNKVFSKITIQYRVAGAIDQYTARVDGRALDLYKRNVRLIIALCRAQGIRPIMVPQVLNYDLFVPDKPDDWMPFVRGQDVKPILDAYNKELAQVCAEEKADFVAGALDGEFDSSCFIDNGHFSARGSMIMARIIRQYLLEHL